jgi:large subunit ribosomal protein L29
MAATATELRGLLDDELVNRLREAKEGLKTVKHDIARIYTVMRERELGLTSAPASSEA